MADVSAIRTNWQNVSQADYLANNTKAQNNRIDAASMNDLGQALIDVNAEVVNVDAAFDGVYSSLGTINTKITTLRTDLDDALFEFSTVSIGDLPSGMTFTLWYDGGWPPRPTSRAALPVQWCSVNYQGIPPTAIPGIDFLKVMEYQSIPNPDPDPEPQPTGNILAVTTLSDQTEGLPIGNSNGFTAKNPGTASLTAMAAAASHGAMGMRATGAAQSRVLSYVEETATTDPRVIDFNFRINAINANAYIASMADSINGGTRCDVRINADRSMTCRSAQVAAGASAEDVQLQTGVWYRFQWRVSTASQHVRIYDMANEEYVMDFLGTITNSLHNENMIGLPSQFTLGTIIDMDNLRVGDDWLPAHVS